MAVAAIEPDVFAVKLVQKGYRIRAARIGTHSHRSGLLAEQKVRQKEREGNRKNEPRPLERGCSERCALSFKHTHPFSVNLIKKSRSKLKESLFFVKKRM
jgi:hypothetical protein